MAVKIPLGGVDIGAPLALKPPQHANPAAVVRAHPWVPPALASVKVPTGGLPRP